MVLHYSHNLSRREYNPAVALRSLRVVVDRRHKVVERLDQLVADRLERLALEGRRSDRTG